MASIQHRRVPVSTSLPVFDCVQLVSTGLALDFNSFDLASFAIELPVVLSLVPVDEAEVPPLPTARSGH